MGVMPVNKLIITMSLPIMASMLVQAAYNIVDSIFVAKIGQDALTALSLAFPVQNLMIGVATGTGVGMNALLSKSLGERKFDKANKTAANGVFLSALAAVAFLIIGIFGSEAFFRVQTDNENIIRYGTEYLTVCTVGSIFLYMQVAFERIMQSTGKTLQSMFTQGAGAITNIVFDPIFIFLFGWDVIGAALATVLGQAVSCFVGIYLNRRYNKEITVSFKGFRPDGSIIKRIYSVGVPSMIMVGIGSVMNFSLNKILINFFNETAATVLGVYYKLQSFAFMPVFGLNNGMVPIIAYNYGAKNKKRLTTAIKLALIYASLIMLLAMVVFRTVPELLIGFFSPTRELIAMGVPAFKTISLSYVFAGVGIAMTSVFQAFGKGIHSMLVSVARQLVVLIPAAYLLAIATTAGGNPQYVWWSFPIAEVVSLTVSLIFYKGIYKNIIKKL